MTNTILRFTVEIETEDKLTELKVLKALDLEKLSEAFDVQGQVSLQVY